VREGGEEEELVVVPEAGVCGEGRLIMTWLPLEESVRGGGGEGGAGGMQWGTETIDLEATRVGAERDGAGGERGGERAGLVTKDITSLKEVILPSDSAVLHCDYADSGGGRGVGGGGIGTGGMGEGGKEGRIGEGERGGLLAQLILEPRIRAGVRAQAARAEARYTEWRERLPGGAAARLARERPNVLLIMVDSLSRHTF
jgi:hypothetical protein